MKPYEELEDLLTKAQTVILLQADNPDGDSLGSTLALEAILSEMGKTVYMVCAVDMPSYLHYLRGWSRVVKDIPQKFDMTIMLDNNTESLLENLAKQQTYSWLKAKPFVVVDHHIDSSGISFASLTISEPAVATSEILYRIVSALKWPLPLDACEMMAVSIMSDSVGLMSDTTSPESIRTVADLVENGVSLARIDDARRELMRKDPVLIPYKGQLLERVKFSAKGKVASVIVPWEEIERYSPLYNPTMLVLDDMRMVTGVDVAIGYKVYRDGKITAKIRTNYGKPIAHKIAHAFGGGGHDYAAGFKLTNKTPILEVESRVEQEVLNALQEIAEGL